MAQSSEPETEVVVKVEVEDEIEGEINNGAYAKPMLIFDELSKLLQENDNTLSGTYLISPKIPN